jgi:hypothetical protein
LYNENWILKNEIRMNVLMDINDIAKRYNQYSIFNSQFSITKLVNIQFSVQSIQSSLYQVTGKPWKR